MSETLEAEVVQPSQAIEVRQTGEVGKALPADQIKPPITAAQAKIEAIADLTHSAYSRAATLELTPEESKALQADFPDEAFKPGAAGKEHLIYIEHAHLRDRFCQVFGMGKWAIVPRNRWAEPFKTQKGVDGSRVYVEAMLVIRGCFVAEAIGEMEYYPSNASQNYGDAVEGAESAAFRRCAKKFGVGLQAWKKDWTEGWWARRRGGRDFSRKPAGSAAASVSASPPPSTPTPASKTPLAPRTGPSLGGKTVSSTKIPFPTESSRSKMIAALKAGPGEPNRDLVTEYFRKLENPAQLLPGEEIEELPLRFVPATRGQMNALSEMLTRFGNGDRAQAAFPPHEEPQPPKPKGGEAPSTGTAASSPQAKTTTATKPTTGSSQPTKQPKDDEWWRDVIIPVPHKGEKRDDYLKHPETIGQLYEMRRGQDEECQSARQRLWGFINHYEPKGWTKRDGTPMPPSDSDLKFREALDALADWHERNHPDEKF